MAYITRHPLVVRVKTTKVASVTERDAGLDMLAELPGGHRKTVGGNQGFDTFEFVGDCRALNIRPHIAHNTERKGGSVVDGRTTCMGCAISQYKRQTIERTFS